VPAKAEAHNMLNFNSLATFARFRHRVDSVELRRAITLSRSGAISECHKLMRGTVFTAES